MAPAGIIRTEGVYSLAERIAYRLFSEHGKFAVVKLRSDELVDRLVKWSNPGNTVEYYHFYEGVLPMKAVESPGVLSSTK